LGLGLGFIFCFYFVSAKLWTGGTIAPAKLLPSAFWQQNRHCLFKFSCLFLQNNQAITGLPACLMIALAYKFDLFLTWQYLKLKCCSLCSHRV